MTAPVITRPSLPATAQAVVPRLSRDQRAAELKHLAEETVLGIAPSDFVTALAVGILASPSLRPGRKTQKWATYLCEYRQWTCVRRGEAGYEDFDLHACREDKNAALNDLIDGTSTYRGVRP